MIFASHTQEPNRFTGDERCTQGASRAAKLRRPASILPDIRSTTLTALIRSQAERFADRILFRFLGDREDQETCLSYRELDRRALAVAAHLQAIGAGGERVLILNPPGLGYVTALVGCFYAGAVAVPAYPLQMSRGPGRLREIVADSQAKFALADAATLRALPSRTGHADLLAGLRWISSDEAEAFPAGSWEPPQPLRSAVAALQYTSGSTSAPKGVLLSHGNFLDNVAALAARGGISADDRCVCWLPPYHDMGLVSGILLPLCLGAETVLLAPGTFLRRPLRWLQAIARHAGTVSGAPNFAYDLCAKRVLPAQAEQLDLRSWRLAFSGAERIRAETLERFTAAFARAGFRPSAVTPCYGLAEATVGLCGAAAEAPPTVVAVDEAALAEGFAGDQRNGRPSRKLVGCGTPFEDTELVIADPRTCEPKLENQVGEIWARSPSVASGYWGKPQLSQEVFSGRLRNAKVPAAGGFLRTGDLGFLREGELFVVGRIKDLIVLHGVNHYPEDIEGTVESCHPRLRPSGGAAFGIDEDGEERLVVVHEIDHSRDLPFQEIAAAARHAVAEAHQLRLHRLVLVAPGQVPKTSSGKVRRGLCRDRFLAAGLKELVDPAAAAEPPPASPDLVDRVRRLMAEQLELPDMAASEDFFLLGGHSLLATQLVSRLRQAFGVDLTLRAVFDAPTPRQLAACIAAAPASAASPVETADRRRIPVLSFSQERMWLLHLLEPQGAAYNVAAALQLDGSLDVDALRRAFDAVPGRHEVLRSTFPAVDGEPAVHIAATASLEMAVADLSTQADPQAAAMAAASAMAQAPFDVARGPLLRAALYRTAPQTHVLAVCMHHLVTDAWSIGLLVSDVLHCYDAFASGRPPQRQPAAFSYADYAQWQRRHFTDDRLRPHLAYWKARLDGARPLELPTDRPRSSRRSSAGSLLPLELPAELMESLARLAAAHGTTLFMVLLAGFEVLLHRHSGSSDLVVGIPIANRNRLESESVMGSLVNTVALRLQIVEGWSFSQLLQQLRELALEAYEHQDLPFERLVSGLAVERRPGETPLIRVMFDFQNAPMPGRSDPALRIRPLQVSRGASQFDLSLHVLDTALGRTAGIEYSTELFDADTIVRLRGHLLSILAAVARDPAQPVAGIPLLSQGEREELFALACSPQTVQVPPGTVSENVAAQAAASPRAPAVLDADGGLSYGLLESHAAALAAHLCAMGAAPGERIAVFLDRDRSLVTGLLAVLKTGAAYVPLDPSHPAERIALVLADARPRLVLTVRKLQARLPDGVPKLCVEDIPAQDSAPATAVQPRNPRSPAYLMYTSGSTGRPKGVEVSSAALSNFLHSMRRVPGIDRRDRLLSVTTIAFDIAGLELWLPLTSGACLYLAPSQVAADGAALLALMEQWRPTIMQATPSTWKMLLEHGWKGDPALKILCGGEPLAPKLAAELLSRSQSVWNMYGPTETTIWSTVHRVRDGEGPLVPIGVPIDQTRIYIVDGRRQLVPMGVAGEICIAGAGVANGYFGLPELTGQRFVPDPFGGNPGDRMYRTGDAGRLRSDGRFECFGRLDQQIKLRGFRIEPGEIESVLKEHPAVHDALVVVREDRPGEPCLAAYYIPQPPDRAPAATPEALLETARRKLPSYMLPATFVPLPSFPLTPNGKIDRRALPAPAAQDRAAQGNRLDPRDPVEAALVQLWQDILQLPGLGIRDSFFDLGGHSLLAAKMFARIASRFGVSLPLSSLLEGPTIEHLAARIRAGLAPDAAEPAAAAAKESGGFRHLVSIRCRGTRPTLFCVHGAGGNVLNFAGIARHLGPDRPFFGLQATGVDGRSTPAASIEQMASGYLGELRAIQPGGPYYLGGYCLGGVIAFEMAQQLRRQGEAVALLVLIDCYGPGLPKPPSSGRRNLRAALDGEFGLIGNRLAVKLRRESGETADRLRIETRRLLRQAVPYELRDFWLTQALLRTSDAYRPAMYGGRLTLLRTAEADPQFRAAGAEMGWTGLASAGIETYEVPGNHHTLTQEPNVAALAATLDRCLEAAERAIAG